MQLETWMIAAGAAGGAVLLFALMAIVLSRFYVRASADEALVRTGSGGVKVVIGGGILSLPVLHQVMRVSLRTVTLTVKRLGKEALVTKDKIKACCTMELYLKVDTANDGIIKAAQSFGTQNVEANTLAGIVEGKLTDALRGVAANKDFSELHANREEFAEAVKKALVDELAKNGLKLESTSLTNLSQLPVAEMDKNDVHDAVGLRNILRTVSDAQMESNKLERSRDVTIQQTNVDAKKTSLNLDRQQASLEADQAREVAEYRATQATNQKKTILAKEQEVSEAELARKRTLEMTQIEQEQAVATRDFERQRALAEAQAAKDEAEKTANIKAARAVETAEIEKQKTIQAAEIEKSKAIETAEISKKVAIALAEKDQADAQAQKALATAKETEAEATIQTAQERAQADREKVIAVIKAQKEAEQARINVDRDAYTQKVTAEAALDVAQRRAEGEKAVAEGQANAVREKAKAEADKQRQEAQAAADKRRLEATAVRDAAELEAAAQALKVLKAAESEAQAATLNAEALTQMAEARLTEGRAIAEARRLLVEAENNVDSRLLMLRAAEQAIKISPDVVREFVKSAEAIGEMKVIHVSGLGSGSGDMFGELSKTPLGLGLTTLAQAAAVSPIIKGLMDHAGIKPENVMQAVVEKAKTALAAGTAEFTKAKTAALETSSK